MLEKLYAGAAKDIICDIEKIYLKKGYCVVNFLYFANAMQYRLFEIARTDIDKKYRLSLEDSDFLLTDGIALQVWDSYTYKPKRWLQNLNGTDLTPQILSYFSKNYTVHLYISSLYDEKIGKGPEWLDMAVEKFKGKFGINVVYAHQTHYREKGQQFPFQQRETHESSSGVVKIFLNCTGTPFQEIWTYEHKKRFEDNGMLVINAGGFIDFFAGFETRAPKWVVKMRILETFWRIATNPKKNFKKFAAMFGVFRLLGKRVIGKK